MSMFNGFVVENDLVPVPTATVVIWDGRIYCADGFALAVTKNQEVEVRHDRPWVRTVRYSYQGLHHAGGIGKKLFRYDNYHAHPGHPDRHHKHRCDTDGNEIEPPDFVGAGHWPTLSDALEELRQIWVKWQRDRV